MAKEGAKAIVPKVRFPEFEGNTHWTISKLGARGRFLGGGTPSRENAEFWAGIHPWISSSDISDEEIRPVRPSRFITDEAVARSATQVVPAGSVLIVARVGVGKVAVSEEQLHTSQDFANLVPSSDSPAFLAYLLKSRKSALLAFNQGMAIKGFTRDDIAGLEVPIPDKPEQQKIADCLTSLDEVIAAQGCKVEALKAHKRGLMQQLFPREGETRPRLRFPEFHDAPEWVETTIGEVGNFYYGKSAPKWSLEKDAATSCVRYGELYTKFDVVITETISRTNIDPRNLRFSKGGEVLVPRVGEKPEDFGRCCCYLPLANVAIGEMISVFETDQNPLFYTYYFRRMYREFAKVVEGQNVKNLYYTELEPLAICRPSIEEQKVISDCLLSLDKRIASESDQLAALKTHKQGLMQQLFPVPEAG